MEIPDEQIPAHMHDYLKKTGRKRIPGTRKLCSVMEAKKTLLYTPVLKWYADTIFTNNERTVDKAMPSPYLEDLEEIWGAYEIREGKRYVSVDRAYQCGIAVYQLAKLRMLEFYYDFLDKYVDRRDYEYCYMDTDSAYFVISG